MNELQRAIENRLADPAWSSALAERVVSERRRRHARSNRELLPLAAGFVLLLALNLYFIQDSSLDVANLEAAAGTSPGNYVTDLTTPVAYEQYQEFIAYLQTEKL